ncbi:MAG: hypothetical protein NZ550_04015 [Fimbriimonadales bacterium]|nr:hypothetical protein [Fimbriimonadales bacterium]MDW8051484.1 hypothetical protein [Armatimonadota bacterium]
MSRSVRLFIQDLSDATRLKPFLCKPSLPTQNADSGVSAPHQQPMSGQFLASAQTIGCCRTAQATEQKTAGNRAETVYN